MTNDPRALSNLSAADFEAIELAVMETARGRWFLKEFAERNRTADTRMLLDAIMRLQGAVSGERAMAQVDGVRFDLMEMAKSIRALKLELENDEREGIETTRIGAATSALDGIVQTTEQATSRILGAAEKIQEVAWSLRENKLDDSICDRIDKLATEIYTACTFQDLTAQHTQKVVTTLRFLEGRINAVIDLWAGQEQAGTPSSPRPARAATESWPGTADAPFSAATFTADDDLVDLAPPVTRLVLPDSGGSDTGEWHPRIDSHASVQGTETDDLLEIDLVCIEADVVEDKTLKTVAETSTKTFATLEQLDALSTTQKAMIFG